MAEVYNFENVQTCVVGMLGSHLALRIRIVDIGIAPVKKQNY
jgi:hypothetical protein